MFNWFKKKREEEKGEPKNLQLISLCLAFEVAASDNDIDKKEKELILNKIKDDVDTGVLNSDEVFEIIKNENEVKVSFYDLIHEINKNLSKASSVTFGNAQRADPDAKTSRIRAQGQRPRVPRRENA